MSADDPRKPDEDDPKDSATELAARIADGSTIDWPGGGTENAAHLDPATVEQLKAIAAIADLRRVTSDDGLGPPTARTWGSLAIVGRIGAGQFGEVFRAWDTRLQREVALKILRAPDSQDPLAPSRAIEEARHLARVRHPNVLTVYGAEQIGDRTGIWTELIEGQTLELLVAKQGPLAERDVVAIAVDLSRALAAVHGAGIVHRDVKAQNVMREVGGRIVLMDFGTGINVSGGTRRPRDLSGTPLYLAPEIFAGAAPNTSTDLYALSVLLFHLLTGDYPVQGATLEEVRTNHEAGNRRRLKDLAPTVSEAIAALIDRGLSTEPEGRYGAASDLEQALCAAAPTARIQTGAVEPSRVGHQWFLAVGIAMTVVVGVWFYFNAAPQDRSSGLVCETCVGPDVQVSGATVSSDGRWLVIADAVSGDFLIRDLQTGKVRSLGLPTAMPLFTPSPEKPGYPSNPVFSADSKSLAFIWVANTVVGPNKVWAVDIFAGPPRQISSGTEALGPIYDVAPDGKSILVSLHRPRRQREDAPGFELAWVSLEGVTRTVKAPWGKATPTGGYTWTMEAPRSARVSPDGLHIAYEWEPANGAVPGRRVRHIFLLKSDGSEQRETVISDADNSNPTWSAEGDRLFFTSDVSGTVDLWSVAVQDGAAVGAQTFVRSDVGDVTSLVMTSDGNAHYWRWVPPRQLIFIMDTAKAKLPTGPTIERSIAGARPGWSDDGRLLRFLRRQSPSNWRSPVAEMTFTVADGREAVDRTEAQWPYLLIKNLSRERHGALFEAIVFAPYADVYGPTAPKSGYLGDDEGMDIELAHRLVGPSLYAFRSDSTGAVRVSAIVAIDVPSGKVRPVCGLPNRQPGQSERDSVGLALSPDSRRLALALWTKGRATLGILEIGTCEYRQIYGPYRTQSTANKLAWSPDGQAVLISEEFGEGNRVGYQILRVPTASGEPQQVIRLNGTDRETSFAMSVDGLLAFQPNPAFQQPFAQARSSLQLWRLDLRGGR